MGKPSSTRLPTAQKSEESVKGQNMSGLKKKLNAQKKDVRNKRNRRKTNNKMKKLFGQLRNQSNITIDSSQNSTVILLDDTIVSPNRKRKLSDCSIIEHVTEPSKCMKTDNLEPVLQVDNDQLVTNTDPSTSTNNVVMNPNTAPCSSKTPRKLFAPPMNCSTPISKSNTNIAINNNADTVQNFNIDSNMTKEINRDSFLTIDLTAETDLNRSSISKTQFNTVIDLDNTQESQDCTFVSMSNASLSMSGDSDVTVLKNDSRKRINRVVNGIAKLRASEKDRLLEMITKKIFSGCKLPERVKSNLSTIKFQETESKGTDTVENSYIKEVILGEKPSRNSIGSNIYNPGKDNNNKTGLRMIVIDGSNVAMEHGKGRVFSVRGLKICIDYFLKRGHVVKAFVPRFRCKFGKSSEPRLLDDLERRGLVVYTPSREIQGKMVTSYDDRYIVQCAAEFDGVIVSGDQYRDLLCENPRWRSVIETRLLPFTWVNDMIMFPKDPLGRNGPTLEVFLRHPVTKAVPSIVL